MGWRIGIVNEGGGWRGLAGGGGWDGVGWDEMVVLRG